MQLTRDEIYGAEQVSARLRKEWQMLYRLRDHVFQDRVNKEFQKRIDDGQKISRTAVKDYITSTGDWAQYLEDMVNAEEEYSMAALKVDHLKRVYFDNKADIKNEREILNPDSYKYVNNYKKTDEKLDQDEVSENYL